MEVDGLVGALGEEGGVFESGWMGLTGGGGGGCTCGIRGSNPLHFHWNPSTLCDKS